jgi:uncharacterized protein
MKIALDQIRETPRALSYVEEAAEVDALNRELDRGAGDFHVPDGVAVDIAYHRAGLDVFVDGTVRAGVRGTCARCLAEYEFALETPVGIVLAPAAAAVPHTGPLRDEDIGLAYYQGEEIDLTPLIHEQALLALPTRPLCTEACRGLCPRCGANLNAGPCGCPAASGAGRLAVLQTLLRER